MGLRWNVCVIQGEWSVEEGSVLFCFLSGPTMEEYKYII